MAIDIADSKSSVAELGKLDPKNNALYKTGFDFGLIEKDQAGESFFSLLRSFDGGVLLLDVDFVF